MVNWRTKPGPWLNEPDRDEWRDPKTGLVCLIVRHSTGALCGYVGVPPEHPFFEMDYGNERMWSLNVHGGLTYSDHCSGHICHTPALGEPDTVWWLGFDCGHLLDYIPGMPFPSGTYRTF